MPFSFELVTPQAAMLKEQAESLTIMTDMGEITVLPNHIPIVATLRPGEARVKIKGEERAFAVFGGFLQVRPGNHVVVLADEAERVEDLILEEAEAAKSRAEKVMTEKFTGGQYEEAALALERERARFQLAKKYKAKGLQTPKRAYKEKALNQE